MPNWCENSIEVTGPTQDIIRFANIGIKPDDPEKDGALEDYRDTTDNRDVESWRISRYYPTPDNVEDAYDWHVEHWGTKWDCGCYASNFDIETNNFSASFLSAWSPPVEWLRHVQRDFPTLRFKLLYVEPGMNFSGIAYTQQTDTREIEDETEDEIAYCDSDDIVFRHNEDSDQYESATGVVLDLDADDSDYTEISVFHDMIMWWEPASATAGAVAQ